MVENHYWCCLSLHPCFSNRFYCLLIKLPHVPAAQLLLHKSCGRSCPTCLCQGGAWKRLDYNGYSSPDPAHVRLFTALMQLECVWGSFTWLPPQWQHLYQSTPKHRLTRPGLRVTVLNPSQSTLGVILQYTLEKCN